MAHELYNPGPDAGLEADQDAAAVALACNDDGRFRHARWEESPETILELRASHAFQERLIKLLPSGRRVSLGALVAAIYGCRLTERGASRRRQL